MILTTSFIFSVGCAIMYTGEGRFQSSVNDATNYIVNQGISVVNNLISVYNYLSSAKNIALNQYFLPPNLISEIDKVNSLINATGNLPHVKSAHITDSMLNILNPVYVNCFCINIDYDFDAFDAVQTRELVH